MNEKSVPIGFALLVVWTLEMMSSNSTSCVFNSGWFYTSRTKTTQMQHSKNLKHFILKIQTQ